MKYVCVLFLLLSFSVVKAQDLTKRQQDSLAFELCRLSSIDQVVRESAYWDVLGIRNIDIVDSLNLDKFISFVKQNGFPNKKLVGSDNWNHSQVSMTGFLYLVHHPKKIALKYCDLFKSEIDKGNLSPELFSYALDRYYVSSEGRSYFNTPYKAWSIANGVCLQDKSKSDSLRISIGLNPLPLSDFIDCSKIDMTDKPKHRPLVIEYIPE